MELYVRSPAFDKDCEAAGLRGSKTDNSDSDHFNYGDFQEYDDTSSSRYDVSDLEAHLYYSGIRGRGCRGPKLIFRMSKDVFTIPPGPWQVARPMRLLPVYEHPKLGKDDVWANIRSKVCDPFEAQQCAN